ncbi:hypothetical protein M404DRAFT_38868, partial [Pisolithus tinctorius Marx 270]
ITLQWIAGHMEIEGNKLKCFQCKLAAKGDIPKSPSEDLLSTLAEHLPISVSTLTQAYAAKLKSLWNREWQRSPHHSRISRIDPFLPSNSF